MSHIEIKQQLPAKAAYTLALPETISDSVRQALRPYIAPGSSSKEIHIRREGASAALKYIAVRGGVYFSQKPLFFQLLTKLFLHVELHWEKEGGRLFFFFVNKEKKIPYDQCQLWITGDVDAVIIEGVIYFVASDLGCKAAAKNGELLSKQEIEKIQEEIDVSSHVTFLEKGAPAHDGEVHPVLELTDATGGFARLYVLRKNLPISKQEKEFTLFEKDLIETGFQRKQVGKAEYYCPLDKATEALTLLYDCGWEVRTHQGKKVKKLELTPLSVEKIEHDYVIHGELFDGERVYSLGSLLPSLRASSLFIEKDGQTLLIDWKSLGVSEAIFKEATPFKEGIRMKGSAVGLLQGVSRQLLDLPSELEELFSHNPIDVSLTSFTGSLYGYQRQGVEWLKKRELLGFGALLADEMGLGKTVQVLALLSSIKGSVLIITPATLLQQWYSEVNRFIQDAKVTIYHGIDRVFPEEGIIITSYALVRREIEFFSMKQFGVIVLDESQIIKNPDTETAKAIHTLQGHFRVALTGTPIENSVIDMWSQFQFLEPSLFPSKSELIQVRSLMEIDKRHAEIIRKKLAPFVLRRSKQEVEIDLPPLVEQTVILEFSPQERALYDRLLPFIAAKRDKKLELLEIILRLRQMCIFPWAVDPNFSESCTKMESILEDAQQVVDQGAKVIIFSQFTTPLLRMKERLNGLYIDGNTTKKEQIFNQFQQTEGGCLLYMSLKVGGIGVNLSSADYVLLYDPWWNEAVEMQAISRAHRIGRTHSVIAKRYIIKDSIEEKIQELKQRKRDMFETLFEDVSSEHVSLDQLIELLS